jgi:hypothetical protein
MKPERRPEAARQGWDIALAKELLAVPKGECPTETAKVLFEIDENRNAVLKGERTPLSDLDSGFCKASVRIAPVITRRIAT